MQVTEFLTLLGNGTPVGLFEIETIHVPDWGERRVHVVSHGEAGCD